MPDTLKSVLSVLTALIAPALLVSACGTFIISTSNRLALNTERVRLLVVRLEKLTHFEPTPGRTTRLERLRSEAITTFRRVLLQQWALALFYAAAVLFVACSLTLGMEAITTVLPPWLPVALGLVGVAILLAACALLVIDVHRLVKGMVKEMAEARQRF